MKNLLLALLAMFFVVTGYSLSTENENSKNASLDNSMEVEIACSEKLEVESCSHGYHRNLESDRIHQLSSSNDRPGWKDTKCGTCDKRCCVKCTADGDPGRCAETKFKNCRTCGHASNGHYAVSSK